MTTVLEKTLKREVTVGSEQYTLTISPDGLKLVPKGKRNGVELQWLDLVSGQAALAVALNASLDRVGALPLLPEETATAAPPSARPSARKKK